MDSSMHPAHAHRLDPLTCVVVVVAAQHQHQRDQSCDRASLAPVDDHDGRTDHCVRPLTPRSARERVGLLPHAVMAISAFIDSALPPRWTIPRACEHGHVRMLPRLAAREPVDMNEHYRAHVFSQGLVHAARRGDLCMVQWLCCEYCPHGFAWKGMEAAAAAGELAVLQWLTARYSDYCPPESFLDIDTSNLEVLQRHHGVLPSAKPTVKAMTSAIANNDIAAVEWLCCHSSRAVRSGALSFALRSGNFAIAKLFQDVISGVANGLSARVSAIESGNLEVVKWVHELLGPPSASAIHDAMACGHLDIMKWVYANAECPQQYIRAGCFGERGMDKAAGRGHMETLLWLHEHYPTECSALAMNNAAASGHLDIVQWLHTHRTEGCTADAIDSAARNGHLHVIEWLHAHRSEGFSSRAVRCAAAYGHLDVVKWFHANSLGGFGAFVMDVAATHNHMHVVQWIHANRWEGCTAQAMNGAAENNHLEMVQWLHANRTEGCTSRAMDLAATNNHLEMVQWLHANRTEGCSTDAMDGAASLEMVQWLHEHRHEGCTADAMDNAIKRNDFELVLWLHKHRSEGCTIMAVFMAEDDAIFQWLCNEYPGVVQASGILSLGIRDEYLAALLQHMRRRGVSV